MRIAIKGRNTPVTDDLREHVEKRFRKIAKQVSPLAELEVEVMEELHRMLSLADEVIRHKVVRIPDAALKARAAPAAAPAPAEA